MATDARTKRDRMYDALVGSGIPNEIEKKDSFFSQLSQHEIYVVFNNPTRETNIFLKNYVVFIFGSKGWIAQNIEYVMTNMAIRRPTDTHLASGTELRPSMFDFLAKQNAGYPGRLRDGHIMWLNL